MNRKLTFQTKVQFRRGRHGQKRLVEGESKSEGQASGRLPRVTRLMALAIRFDGLIRSGAAADQAELARLGRVTRARMTQIMNLLLLAPDIQESLLFLAPVTRGRCEIHLRLLQPIAQVADWQKQRALCCQLLSRSTSVGRN
jgi:hypothetical protein